MIFANLRMAEMNEAGVVVNKTMILMANGFRVGQCVIRKQDKQQGKIVNISESGVELEVEDEHGSTQNVIASCDGFMDGQWREYRMGAPPKVLGIDSINPSSSWTFAVALFKARIMTAMDQQWEKMKVNLGSVQLQSPKNLLAMKDFAEKKFTLGCATLRVLVEDPSNPETSNGIQIGLFRKYKVVLGASNQFLKDGDDPASTVGFVNPCWWMKTCETKDECNVEWVNLNPRNDWTNPKKDISLPYIRSFTKIESGEDIILFQQAPAKRQAVETLKPVVKRPRHS